MTEVTKQIKRWRGGRMVLRWTVAGLQEAERRFQKLKGYRGLKELAKKLKQRDQELDREERAA